MSLSIPYACSLIMAAIFGVLALIAQLVYSMGPDEVPFTPVANATQRKAVCIDGSPAGYHYAVGHGNGSENWLVYLAGGGWCENNTTCQFRRKYSLGSSTNHKAANLTGMLSNKKDINPDFYNWNRVYVYYCDQSSFLGDTEIADQGPNLQFRGSRNFDAVVDDLVAQGMGSGKNAILGGGSAGGLAAILQCDHFRERLHTVVRVKCIADSGIFIRAKDLPNADFRERLFASTIKFHNLTNFLPASCAKTRDPSLCFFPEYLIENVRTPLFLLNSAFDTYEIQQNLEPLDSPDLERWKRCVNIYPNNSCTAIQNKLIKDFGITFLETIMGIPDSPSRGLFINTCFIHVFTFSEDLWNPNSSFKLDNMTISQAVSDWYFDRSSVKLIDVHTDFPKRC